MKNWNQVKLVPEFNEQGVACYKLAGGNYVNEYYVVSEAETRKLLNTPEIVGYEVYDCLIPSTSQMLYYFKEQKKVTTANILSILRGALNYPLEESCYREHIRVHDISFLSSERVFADEEIAGLEIKYSKLTMVPDSTLMIGDIIASGETLIHCLRYVTDFYRKNGAKLRNIIIFTIGGTKGIEILENLTREIREFWPEFEGFITVYYEGIFSTYQDKGVSGINLPDVYFYFPYRLWTSLRHGCFPFSDIQLSSALFSLFLSIYLLLYVYQFQTLYFHHPFFGVKSITQEVN